MDKKSLLSLLANFQNFSFNGEDFSISLESDTLVLLTGAGQITGKPVNLNADITDAKSLKEKIGDSFFISIANAYKKNCKEDNFILLKDATLRNTSDTSFHYDFLYVFTGDVIAVTIAKDN